MAIELTDDGTLDTVLRCSECGEEMRYNYDGGMEPGTDEDQPDREQAALDAYDTFVEWAIEDAAADHECPLAFDDSPTCKWTQSDNWEDSNRWDTDCDQAFVFMEDGPAENGIKFCCYCGKPVTPVPYVWENEDEDDGPGLR